MICYALVFNGVAAAVTGFGMPAPPQLGLLVLAGGFARPGRSLLLLASAHGARKPHRPDPLFADRAGRR